MESKQPANTLILLLNVFFRCILECEVVQYHQCQHYMIIIVDGQFYYMFVTFPMPDIPYQGWHGMIAYFPSLQSGEAPSNFELSSQARKVLDTAFSNAIRDIMDEEGCNCATSKVNRQTDMRLLSITSVRLVIVSSCVLDILA